MKPNRRKPRIAPGVWTEAERLMRAGVANLEIANRLGMAEGTVRNRRKRLGVPAAPPVPDAPVPKVADAKPTDVGASPMSVTELIALVHEMIGEIRGVAQMAKEDRNSSAAARAMGDIAKILPLLGRLEKLVHTNQDAVMIPRESIDTLTADVYANARTLGSVPLACPHCLRDLRMAAVGAERDKP